MKQDSAQDNAESTVQIIKTDLVRRCIVSVLLAVCWITVA